MAAYAATGADCVVAFGGGSTIGLGKAIAYRNGAPQVVVATTYAGSGDADPRPDRGRVKTTVRGASILPEVVIYDPDLTLGLPVAMSVTSGFNAIAHAVEGLYAQDRNPVSLADGARRHPGLTHALPRIVAARATPRPAVPRSTARGSAAPCSAPSAWRCTTLCHTSAAASTCRTPRPTLILPHSAAYNAAAAADAPRPAAALFGGDLGGGLWDLAGKLGAPGHKDLGLKEADLDRAADLAVKNPLLEPAPSRWRSARCCSAPGPAGGPNSPSSGAAGQRCARGRKAMHVYFTEEGPSKPSTHGWART